VPWRLIGDSVLVTVTDTAVRIHHAGREVAVHATLSGHRQRAIDPAHYAGVAGANGRCAATPPLPSVPATAPASLVRDLGEYEALLGALGARTEHLPLHLGKLEFSAPHFLLRDLPITIGRALIAESLK
jgi:hypothetical protein